MIGTRPSPWPPLLAAIMAGSVACACGSSGEPRHGAELGAPPPVGSPPAGGVKLSNTWDFGDGRRLVEPSLSPIPAVSGAPLRIGLQGTQLEDCEARLFASAPRDAARQTVWRGGATPPSHDDRTVRGAGDFGPAGEVEIALVLPRPWHPGAVTVELELWCAGARRPVVAGPRRELREGRRRLPGARAVLGVFEVRRTPPLVDVPRASPRIDGVLDPQEWPGSGIALVDSVDGEPVRARPTTVWLAWDDDGLYVGARVRDPDIWSEFELRDDPLWEQEVFEIFVAGPEVPAGARAGRYLELQVSPAGVVFDARFADYRDGDPGWDGTWTSAVALEGSLNDGEPDVGWSVEVGIPWAELCENVDLHCPVSEGQTLRLNAFRFERIDRRRPLASAVSPTLATDFHDWANAARLELSSPVRKRR